MMVRKAVIAAADRSTRQDSASTTMRKKMFPLVDVDELHGPTIPGPVGERRGTRLAGTAA